MTVSQIIKEINNLPNFLYIYWNPSDAKDHMVILGGQSCLSSDTDSDMVPAFNYNVEMQEIYRKSTLEEADKYRIVKLLKLVQNMCDYRKSGLFKLAQQEKYLSELNDEQLEEVSEQVEMYKLARSLYKDYH